MILLKLEGCPGDSVISGYDSPAWIACTSVSWSIERTFSESAKAGTLDVNVGVADLPPISISKTLDKASPYLMAASIAGGAVGGSGKMAELHFLFATDSGEQKKFLEYKLYNPIITSWSISGDEDERPTEEISLWYWKIWMKYWTWDGTTYAAGGDKGWDRTKNVTWTGT